jgi:hypothetical protein
VFFSSIVNSGKIFAQSAVHDSRNVGECSAALNSNDQAIAKGGFPMEFEGYCVKCREKRQIKDGKVEVNEKGRRMAKGVCPVCGTNVTRFLPSEAPK